MNRQTLKNRIERHGWTHKLYFGRDWPFFVMTGDFPGYVTVPLPVKLDDDHGPALKQLYTIVADLKDSGGQRGRA